MERGLEKEMLMYMPVWSVAAVVFLWNLPFGYWRGHAGKYSRQWFLAIHLPVPAVVALRILSGLGWQLSTFPILAGSFFAGQFVGGRLHHYYSERMKNHTSSCLFVDIFRRFPLRRSSRPGD